MINPIIDWSDEDVWQFLNENNIPHCSLYDEGYSRLGCIGCPLAGTKEMLRDFERYPKYKELYIRAFQRMIENHPGEIRRLDPNADTKFKLFEEPTDNLGGGVCSDIGSTRAIDDNPGVNGSDTGKIGGGSERLVQMVDGVRQLTEEQVQKSVSDSISTTVTPTNDDIYISGQQQKNGSTTGSNGVEPTLGQAMFNRWLKVHYC